MAEITNISSLVDILQFYRPFVFLHDDMSLPLRLSKLRGPDMDVKGLLCQLLNDRVESRRSRYDNPGVFTIQNKISACDQHLAWSRDDERHGGGGGVNQEVERDDQSEFSCRQQLLTWTAQ